MLISRFLFALAFGFIACSPARGQITPAQSPSSQNGPEATPAERPITFSFVHVDGPFIAMTFDYGPSPTLTPKLLHLLAAHHIKATFFVIGQNAADLPEILQRAAREGHE